MERSLEGIIRKYRSDGLEVSEEEAEEVRSYCFRKMDLCGIKNQKEYLPLLFEDELRNYLFRRTVNAITYIRMALEEDKEQRAQYAKA